MWFPCVLGIFYFINLINFSSAGTNCQNQRVQSINQLSRDYSADTNFYKKFVNANGIPIMSSDGVSDYALKECARIIQGVTRNLKSGFLNAMIKKRQRIALWAKDSTACSIPEVTTLGKPCTYKDFKGGLAFGNMLILQETNFKCDERGNAWIGRVLVHEFNHGVNRVFDNVDQDLQKSLDRAYANAKAGKLWPPNEYAMTNGAEYFAIGAQTWFEANEKRHCDISACDKIQLQSKDKQLYNLVARVYQGPDWLYKCNEFCDRDQSQCCTTVYVQQQFQGQSKQFCGNVPFVGQDWNDHIRSLKMTQGCVVEVYEHLNYQGLKKILKGDFASLGADLQMDKHITSLRARPA